MKRLLHKLLNLSRPAYYALQVGLSASAVSLWLACLMLIKAGPLRIETLSRHLLARELQTTSIGILTITVIAACVLEEKCGT